MAGLGGLIEQIERGFEADAIMAAHQAFMTEDGAGADLDDRLEGVFDDQLGKGDELVTGKTPAAPPNLPQRPQPSRTLQYPFDFMSGNVPVQSSTKAFRSVTAG